MFRSGVQELRDKVAPKCSPKGHENEVPRVQNAVPFLGPPGGPQNGTMYVGSGRFVVGFKEICLERSYFWDRLAVPKAGPRLVTVGLIFLCPNYFEMDLVFMVQAMFFLFASGLCSAAVVELLQ
mgnify:CR=1 FL=1